jgi:hypothetical protein
MRIMRYSPRPWILTASSHGPSPEKTSLHRVAMKVYTRLKIEEDGNRTTEYTKSCNVGNGQWITHNLSDVMLRLSRSETLPRSWDRSFYWMSLLDGTVVTCRPMSRQRPKYAHATIEKVLQEVFSMWSAPCPLLGNGSLNTLPQQRMRRK